MFRVASQFSERRVEAHIAVNVTHCCYCDCEAHLWYCGSLRLLYCSSFLLYMVHHFYYFGSLRKCGGLLLLMLCLLVNDVVYCSKCGSLCYYGGSLLTNYKLCGCFTCILLRMRLIEVNVAHCYTWWLMAVSVNAVAHHEVRFVCVFKLNFTLVGRWWPTFKGRYSPRDSGFTFPYMLWELGLYFWCLYRCRFNRFTLIDSLFATEIHYC